MSAPRLERAWVAPARTALLIVDMQVDFALLEGALGGIGADLSDTPAALAAAELLTESARRAGATVVFVGLETSLETDHAAWRENSLRRGADPEAELALCRAGSPGAAFAGPQPAPGDRLIRKRRYSGFLGTDLEAQLRAGAIDTVVVCGMTTECCVSLTALDAFQRGFHVFVAADACAAYGAEVHAAALRAMEMNGVLLAKTDALRRAWG